MSLQGDGTDAVAERDRASGVLGDRGFRLLFAADAISQFGSRITLLALPLVAIVVLHVPVSEVGLLATFETAAFFLVGLPAGAWVDRLRRRPVMITADLGRGVALMSVPVAWWLHVLTMWQLYAVALCVGVWTVFFDVAYQSYLPHLVGRHRLVEANAKLQAVASVSAVGGPPIGGIVVQALTAPYAIGADAVSFLLSAALIGRINKPEASPKPKDTRNGLRRDIVEGFRFVIHHDLLRRIALSAAVFNLATSASDVALLVLLARNLHLAAGVIGLFLASAGIGGLTGAFIAERVARRLGTRRAIWVPLAVAIPCGFVIPFAQADWRLWLAGAAQLVLAAGTVIFNINQVSLRQAVCPDHLLGRMNATMRMLAWSTLPLGTLAGGVLGQIIGIRWTLILAAIILALAVVPTIQTRRGQGQDRSESIAPTGAPHPNGLPHIPTAVSPGDTAP